MALHDRDRIRSNNLIFSGDVPEHTPWGSFTVQSLQIGSGQLLVPIDFLIHFIAERDFGQM